jgi:phage shock protein E
VLYCRSGNMSAEAAETLVGLGYTDVWDVRGGMIAWERAGFRLEGA